MNEIAYNVVNTVWKICWGILILPFVIPAFFVVKLLGGNTFSLDDMGIGFMLTVLIAVALAIAAVSFAIGYFI